MEIATRVVVVRGSLLDQDVEVIVNAANTSLRGGGGIDGAVHRAAGRELVLELMHKYPGGCKPGKVAVSGGHETPFKYIFHTPGPFWRGGSFGEDEILAQCYENACLKAIELEVESIGFCSIGTGIYGFPVERAAPIALSAVKAALKGSSVKKAVFAMYGEQEYRIFKDAVAFR